MSSLPTDSQPLADLQEEITNLPLTVEGTLPNWLKGSYIRNGPVNVAIGTAKNEHWLDGLAMLHQFTIADGSIWYTNRFLRTDAYQQVFKFHSFHYPGFKTSSFPSWMEKLASWLKLTKKKKWSNANQNLIFINKEAIALGEGGSIKFNPTDLTTIGPSLLDPPSLQQRYSSHPCYDLETEEFFNCGLELSSSPSYLICKWKKGCGPQVVVRLAAQPLAYMHSFALTKNYYILTESPLVAVKPFDPTRPFIDHFTWQTQKKSHFLVIDRRTGALMGRYPTVPFFSFHHVNAFEEEGKIFLDLICYYDAKIIERMKDHGRATSESENYSISQLVRFSLPLKNKEVTTNILFKEFHELPSFHPMLSGQKYRYLYLCDSRDTLFLNEKRPLYKLDVQTKKSLVWQQEGCYPGEPFFVPANELECEEEGVVISLVADAKNYSSFLLILNAKTFQEIARAKVPHLIPAGLHGKFLKH